MTIKTGDDRAACAVRVLSWSDAGRADITRLPPQDVTKPISSPIALS